jgi:alkylation response protein AidB-like acyl-CoA dehydrogenase
MDFSLTSEQREIQLEARAFASEKIQPIAAEIDAERRFPLDIVSQLADHGFLAGPLPAEYGGRGMDYISFALVYEEIGRACSSIRGFLAVHVGLVSMCIFEWGTEEQKHSFLPRLARGELIGAYALTEENAGSDVASMEATATPDGDSFLINGTKVWITNGGIASLMLVFATGDRSLKHKAISAFIVNPSIPGIQRTRMPNLELGHRASDHARVEFSNARVPSTSMLGRLGEGFKIAMTALDHGRIGVAAGAVGVGQACLDASVEFARKRRQFDKPIGEFQMVQQTIADMAADIEAARFLVYRAAFLKGQHKPTRRESSIAKLFATEAAMRAASEAVLLHGSRGYSNGYPVERYFRDIKGYQIYEGTSQIQRIIIARELLKQGS